jgi:uncharacterized membrane protein YbhN (UPF0104 family)
LDAPVVQTLGVTIGERVLDLTFVCGSFFLMSWILFGHGSNVIVRSIIESSLYLLAIVILILILLLIPRSRNSVCAVFPIRARPYAIQFIRGIIGSLRGNWFGLILTTAGVSAMECLRFYLVTVALGVDMTIPQVIFTVMATILLASIPISFSGLGFVEGGITDLLKLFRIDAVVGLGIIICDRLISFVSVVVLGLISFLFVKGAS